MKIGREREVPTRFRIKRYGTLEKLFKAYAERLVTLLKVFFSSGCKFPKFQGIQLAMVRFYHDGNRLKTTDTPASMEMENDDLIDAQVDTTGGHGPL